MKERYKTLLLVFLACSSVFLTVVTWMQSPYERIFAFNEKKTEPVSVNFSSIDIIKPDKYLISFDKDNQTIFFSDKNNNLWASFHSSLAGVLSSNDIEFEEISNEEFIDINDERSIVFHFPEKYNMYIIARFLDVSEPNELANEMEEVDSIYVYLGADTQYIVFSAGSNHLKVYDQNLDIENLKTRVAQIEDQNEYTRYYSIRETLKVDNDIYIPYKMSETIPTVYVRNEINTENIKEIRKIAEEFFQRDIDYIREIVEDNGTILYLYKDQVLKIYEDGLLEYFQPLEEEVLERNLYMSINTAIEFLYTYMSLPENLYLSEIQEIEVDNNLGYRFTFEYMTNGFPVILKSPEMKGFIQIETFNNSIRNYKRFVREEMTINEYSSNTDDMLSAFNVINNNYDLLKKDYLSKHNLSDLNLDEQILKLDVLASIDDISIVYFDQCQFKEEEKLIGVWRFTIEDNVYAFDIYNGNLVFKR